MGSLEGKACSDVDQEIAGTKEAKASSRTPRNGRHCSHRNCGLGKHCGAGSNWQELEGVKNCILKEQLAPIG